MADSDKNIVIKPNVGSSTSFPEIKFTGKDNVPFYLHVLDDGTVSFSGRQGEVFSISETLNVGDIFAVADISGIRRMAVNANGAVDVWLNDAQPFKVSSSNTERFRVHQDGNVGINDSAPDKELSIIGINGGNGDIDIARTGGATINLQAQASNGIIGTSSSHNLGLKTNGSVRMTIESGGDVGIGTTSPNRPLHVVGDAYVQNGDILLSRGNYYLQDASDATKRGSFSSAGVWAWENVNVGINETSPATTLDVDGTISGTGHRGLAPYYFKANLNNSSDITGRKDLSTTTSDVTIDWYTTTYTDNSSSAYFSHSTSNRSRIVVEKDGLYTVNFNISWDNTGPNRATVYASIWINGVERDETKSYGYSRGSSYGDKNNCVGSYTERFAADDYIEIKCRGIDFDDASQEVYTINDECTIQVYGWPDRGA